MPDFRNAPMRILIVDEPPVALAGLTKKQIGTALDISGNTVRNLVNSVIEKLGVPDRAEAAATAIQRGLIEMND